MLAALERDGAVVIDSAPPPVPGPGEVVLRVLAAGLNRSDLLHLGGRYRQRAFAHPERPDIPGSEVLGRVVEAHPGVHDAGVGDLAFALTGRAHAEYVAVDARLLLPAPPGPAACDLGALPMALLTEYDAMIGLGGLRAGQRVLVTGATSGVGLVGLGIARAWGASTVIATSRSPAVDQLLHEYGATDIAHDEHELADLGRRIGFDLVVDHVGGSTLEAAATGLRDEATIVSVGRLGGRTACLDLTDIAGRRARLIGTTWKSRSLDDIATVSAQVRADVLPLVHSGRIAARVAHRFGFPEIDRAYELLRGGTRRPGKILVEMPAQDERRAPS